MAKHKLIFRSLAYQEKDCSFTGVCFDLDIVEEGHETLEEAILSINDAIGSYLAGAKLGHLFATPVKTDSNLVYA